MNDLDKQLATLFDVPITVHEAKQEIKEVVVETRKILSDESLIDDIRATQESIRKVMAIGVEAATEAAKQAKTSQDPEAFTALAGLIKSMTDLNLSMIELHERSIGLDHNRADPADQVETTVVNNNLFVGSMAELVEGLRNQVGGRGLEVASSAIVIDEKSPGLHTTKTTIGRLEDIKNDNE